MNQQELRKQQILNDLYNQQLMKNYQNNKESLTDKALDTYLRYKKYKGLYNNALNSGNKIASMGQNMSNFGTKLQGSSNPYLNNIGSKIGNIGTKTTNLGNNLQSGIDTLKSNIATPTATQTPTTLGLSSPTTGLGITGNGVASGQLAASGTGLASGTGAGLGAAEGLSFTGAGTGALGGTAAGTSALGTGTTALGTGLASGSTTAGLGAAEGLSFAGGAGGAAAGGAAAAVPVVGWGLLAAAALYSMLNSARQKKNAKSLQQGMQASAKGEQIANEQTAQAIQNNVQNQQEADQEMAQQSQANGANGLVGTQQPTLENGLTQNGQDMLSQLQNLSFLPQEQITSSNGLYNTAKSIVPKAVDKVNDKIAGLFGMDNPISVDGLLNGSGNGISGQPTGGAAPVTQQTTQPVAQAQQQDPNQLQGGITQTSPAFGQQVYQTSGGTGKIADLIDQFRQGYKDNTENKLGTTYFDPNQQKTFTNKLGEMVGTGQRIASNPIVQGLIAGGVDHAMGSNLGKSMLTGIDWARNKAESDRYEQLINGNNKRSFIGNYDVNDYNAKLNNDYKQQQQQNWQTEHQDKKDKDERDYNFKVQQQKDINDYRNKQLGLKQQEINYRRQGVGGYGKASRGGGSSKGESVAQQKFNYERELNSNIGKFDKYAKKLAKAQETYDKYKDTFVHPTAKSSSERQLREAQEQYDRAREAMLSQYGADFLKYEKDMNK